MKYTQLDLENFIDDTFEDITSEMFMEEFQDWLDGKDARIAEQQAELSADIKAGK